MSRKPRPPSGSFSGSFTELCPGAAIAGQKALSAGSTPVLTETGLFRDVGGRVRGNGGPSGSGSSIGAKRSRRAIRTSSSMAFNSSGPGNEAGSVAAGDFILSGVLFMVVERARPSSRRDRRRTVSQSIPGRPMRIFASGVLELIPMKERVRAARAPGRGLQAVRATGWAARAQWISAVAGRA